MSCTNLLKLLQWNPPSVSTSISNMSGACDHCDLQFIRHPLLEMYSHSFINMTLTKMESKLQTGKKRWRDNKLNGGGCKKIGYMGVWGNERGRICLSPKCVYLCVCSQIHKITRYYFLWTYHCALQCHCQVLKGQQRQSEFILPRGSGICRIQCQTAWFVQPNESKTLERLLLNLYQTMGSNEVCSFSA